MGAALLGLDFFFFFFFLLNFPSHCHCRLRAFYKFSSTRGQCDLAWERERAGEEMAQRARRDAMVVGYRRPWRGVGLSKKRAQPIPEWDPSTGVRAPPVSLRTRTVRGLLVGAETGKKLDSQ